MTSTRARRHPPRIVFWGTCDSGKPRVRILRAGLAAAGAEVFDCTSPVWSGIEDKSQLRGLRAWMRPLGRLLLAYPLLAWRYFRAPAHDWVILGYPALVDVWVIRLLAWLRGAKVAVDWFLSAYDTVVLDRRLVGRRHPVAWALWCAEALSVRLGDLLFMDTAAHARRMEGLFRLPRHRVASVWVGVETEVFGATRRTRHDSTIPLPATGARRVLFYGQFIPLHGADVILDAARLARMADVDWTLIGRGQDSGRLQARLAGDPLPRLTWLPWVDYASLPTHIAGADACLGIFGTSDKAASVIPNKVFQVLATGSPLITRDSPAMRELLDRLPAAVRLVPAGDPQALAEAVQAPLPPRLSAEAQAALEDAISPAAIGQQLLAAMAARGAIA